MNSAGYSGTPLWKKLGIKAETRLRLLNAPRNYLQLLGPGAPDYSLTDQADAADITHLFATERAVMVAAAQETLSQMPRAAMLWVSWPKKASKVPTDITEDVIRETLLPTGLVDVKVCAVDATWSGLKMVMRKELR